MGYLLCAPFLSKMMHSFSDDELNLFFIVSMIWATITLVISPLFSLDFSYRGYFITGYAVVFVSGYYIERVITDSNVKLLYMISLGSFVVWLFCSIYIPDRVSNLTGNSPIYILVCMGAYVLILRTTGNLLKGGVEQVIITVAKHTFSTYLIHYNVLHYIIPKIPKISNYFTIRVICTFIVSYIIGFSFDCLGAWLNEKLSTVYCSIVSRSV